MAGGLVYVTHAAGRFETNLQRNGRFARLIGGARKAILLRRADLEANDIYAAHRNVFDAPRGAGYWAWKPWAILQAMDASEPEDVIFYQDCGFGYRYLALLPLRRLTMLAREKGFVAGVVCPQYGPNRMWNRRRCLEMMGCAGRDDIVEAPSVQATLSFWSNTPEARTFVCEWLDWCLQLDAIRDALPEERAAEAADFVEHRHDQAILTNLVYLRGAFALVPQDATRLFAKSASVLELDLLSRDSVFWRLLYRATIGFAASCGLVGPPTKP
jgi:hypothetical protein